MWREKLIVLLFLVLFSTSCINQAAVSTATSLPNSTSMASWHGIPVYPESSKFSEEKTFYIYKVQDNVENIETFYNEKMEVDGWENFNREDMMINNRREISLYFSKSDRIVSIHILTPAQGSPVQVAINLE